MDENEKKPAASTKRYIGVCVRKSGHAAVSKPTASLEECVSQMKAYVAKHPTDVEFTTYMVRESESEEYTLADAFGHPKSRDLMQDRKFLRSLEGE